MQSRRDRAAHSDLPISKGAVDDALMSPHQESKPMSSFSESSLNLELHLSPEPPRLDSSPVLR
ncbi:hypothetical protein CBOM_04754 [Ceraceosorus bombacis]|uniref:Uncharacterized protein n=1 Tax=Ceraceosorus bombacis TaxID=401625 RepID=A0A0P1BP93_9BASI|nr:hypothetical protein CBOM_04754 [Ceraceosorus bombacis]